MMKAALKIAWPLGSAAISGRMPRSSDTAPRRPTQATKVVSSRWKRNGQRQSQIATGRATKIRKIAERDARQQDARELRRRREQAEDDEHADLREPRHAVLEAAEQQRLPEPPVAGDEPGDIDGEEAAAMQHAGDAEEHQRRRRARRPDRAPIPGRAG